MKVVYCANCGTPLSVKRKALPKYATIVDIVAYHECTNEVEELNLSPVDIPSFEEVEGKNQFVKSLNGLEPPSAPTPDLRDRRPNEDVITSAPQGVQDLFKNMTEEN